MKWTDAQINAINAKGSVIVTAAAGSGKTAVLVERVISKLCDKLNSIPADRLLIVTFTNAAAAEMRQRIEKRLAEECVKYPHNTDLQKQQLLISSAEICTIDSFCIKLVKNHFNLLGISPDFKIADNSTELQIKSKAIKAVFDEHFEKEDNFFKEFLYSTDSAYGDSNAADMVLGLYNFISTLPNPEKWLSQALEQYNTNDFEKSLWAEYVYAWIKADILSLINKLKENLKELLEDVQLSEKCADCYKALIDYSNNLITLSDDKNWNGIYSALSERPFSFPRIIKAKCSNPELLKRLSVGYKTATAAFDNFKKWVFAPTEQLKDELTICGGIIKTAVTLCLEFSEKYFGELNQNGYLTFSLIEQLALKLLTEKDSNGDLVASKLADTICQMYDEIMVDEFQDINDLQGTLFDFLSMGGKKLFTVGDAKQSIYGFRRANPEHFINKSREADVFDSALPPETLKRVVLSNNFRSRKGICDFINGFFWIFMSKDFGLIDYDDNEMLYPKAEYPKNNEPTAEFHIINSAGELTATEAEAEYLAKYVKSLVNNGPFLRDGSGLRKAEFSDIAVLLRSTTRLATYICTLKKYGIPVSIGYGDFFKTKEIMTSVSLLKAIYNPLNDIAMLSVMLSPIFGFTEDEVAFLKSDFKNKKLFSALLIKAEQGDAKCAQLRDKFADWRRNAACMSMADFVVGILKESGYSAIVSSMNDSERRKGNLLILEELAVSFSNDLQGDLGQFLRYLNYVEAAGDIKSYSASTGNSLRFMTFHASKGLQFPICILAGTFSRFNDADEKGKFIFNEKLGIAVNIVDDENNVKVKTATKSIVNTLVSRQQREEELRLLYVAMTRAEEKLSIFLADTNILKGIEKTLDSLSIYDADDKNFNSFSAIKANNYADWLIKYLLMLPSSKEILQLIDGEAISCPLFLREISPVPPCFYTEIDSAYLPNISDSENEESVIDKKLLNDLKEIFAYKYPFEELRNIETKTSVSALTKKQADREFCATSRPAFLSSSGLTPKEKGTALHKFMQYADFNAAINDVAAEIERLYDYEYISRAEADAIDINRVNKFFESDLFARILNSDKLYREQRFLLDVKAGEIYQNLSNMAKEQTVIVQGAVDCMFIEKGKIVLIDFKTDRVNNDESLLNHYAEQLKTYCIAASKMFKLPVTECYIYSLHMSKLIPVKIV